MESGLFEWESSDWISQVTRAFYGVTLRSKLGQFSPGQNFETIWINYQEGTLSVWDGDMFLGEVRLQLVEAGY